MPDSSAESSVRHDTVRPGRVAVVVVMYNSRHLLHDFVASLEGGMAGIEYELVGVDNASPDGSAEMLAELVPAATIVRTGRNGGYAAGINAGVAAARTHSAVLVVNSDVRLGQGCVAELLRRLKSPGVGIAVPKLLDPSGRIIDSMRREPTALRALGDAVLGAQRAGRFPLLGEIVSSRSVYDSEQRTDWAEGSTQLISAQCWDACGPWDESFFLYCEETEYNLRARDHGFATLYVPTASAVHLAGGSGASNELWTLQVTNRIRLFERRNGLAATRIYWLATLLREITRSVMGRGNSLAAARGLMSLCRQSSSASELAPSATTSPNVNGRSDMTTSGSAGSTGTSHASQDDGNEARVDGLSIVCVFNDVDVRRECLDRSIDAYRGDLDVDYRPVDNRSHAFSSAGAALNHGVRGARYDTVVFVHQDVYLHSIDRLARAGRWLSQAPVEWGMLGASGVTGAGEVVGRLRDRTQLIGSVVSEPLDVDSLDEVLFMVSRELVLKEPLSEDPDLAWHAYAVEYGQRLRRSGRRVGAVDLAITHNSLTVNLARLDVAHRAVGEQYPALRPIHTTCGTIAAQRQRFRDLPVVRDHRWRLRWLRHSLVARRLRRELSMPVVLSDIRHEVDLLSFSAESPLHVINVDPGGTFAEHAPSPLAFTRLGKTVVFSAVGSRSALVCAVDELPTSARVLVTGVDVADIDEVYRRCGDRSWIVGIQSDELWILGGQVVRELPNEWSRRKATPLGQARS